MLKNVVHYLNSGRYNGMIFLDVSTNYLSSANRYFDKFTGHEKYSRQKSSARDLKAQLVTQILITSLIN
jgi:hypothetical protein